MLQDTCITLFLLAELVAAQRANDADLFKRWLDGGIQELGEHAGDRASAELACTVHHQG